MRGLVLCCCTESVTVLLQDRDNFSINCVICHQGCLKLSLGAFKYSIRSVIADFRVWLWTLEHLNCHINQKGKKRLLTQQSQTKRPVKSSFSRVEWTTHPVGCTVYHLLLKNRWWLICTAQVKINSGFVAFKCVSMYRDVGTGVMCMHAF